jgi:glucokinase
MVTTASSPRLLADIGGTNARFAWQEGPNAPLQDALTLPCADHETLAQAVQAYLARTGHVQPHRGAFGIANPVHGDWVQMTNHHWSFSIDALRQTLGMHELVVINDFTALALAIPLLSPHETRVMTVGPQHAVPGKAIGVLGAGTGLGMGGLLPLSVNGQLHWAPIEGEGGHINLSAHTEQEMWVLRTGLVWPWPAEPVGGDGAGHRQPCIGGSQRRGHLATGRQRSVPGV